MEFFEVVKSRRAIKHFDPEFVMPEEDKKKIFETAMLSPTAFNLQHWRFVSIESPELREKIKPVAWNQAQVTDASVLVIMCGKKNSWSDDPGQYWKNAPAEIKEYMEGAIDTYYNGRDQVQRDETMRSAGIAGQTIMLAAKALGYDSCPMDGFDFDEVGKIIKLPEDYVIAFMIAIGKRTQDARPRGGQLPLDEVVIKDTF